MSSKTKIVVLRMKEIIYTAIFIGLAILLICLLFVMFHPKKSETACPVCLLHPRSLHLFPDLRKSEPECRSHRR